LIIGEKKQKMDKKDIVVLTILFITAFWLWTLPFQHNHYPFGEGDGAWHFMNGDYAGQTGKSFSRLPSYISYWYYGYNAVLGPDALEYPPPWHLNQGIMQIFGGERVVPVYIYIAISCFLAIFTLYYVMKKLFGTLAAFLVGFILLFDIRAVMMYLFGQRPSIASFVFVPVSIFVFYKYLTLYYRGEHKQVYLYLFILFIAIEYFFHVQGAFMPIFFAPIFTLFMAIKYKKSPISKHNLKHIIFSIAVLLILMLPFYQIYAGAGTGSAGKQISFVPKIQNIARFFHWYRVDSIAYPIVQYTKMQVYGPVFFLLFIGALFLLLKRDDKSLLFFSWLISVYLIFHLEEFGIFNVGRVQRMIPFETYLFVSLIVVGLLAIPQFIKLSKANRTILQHSLTIIFIVLVLISPAKMVYSTLKDAYGGIARMTKPQYEVAEWLRRNTDENAIIHDFGTLTYPKKRFIYALSQRVIATTEWKEGLPTIQQMKDLIANARDTDKYVLTHALIDYSDLIAIGNQNAANIFLGWEQNTFNDNNSKLIYNQNNIRVYELG